MDRKGRQVAGGTVVVSAIAREVAIVTRQVGSKPYVGQVRQAFVAAGSSAAVVRNNMVSL